MENNAVTVLNRLLITSKIILAKKIDLETVSHVIWLNHSKYFIYIECLPETVESDNSRLCATKATHGSGKVIGVFR